MPSDLATVIPTFTEKWKHTIHAKGRLSLILPHHIPAKRRAGIVEATVFNALLYRVNYKPVAGLGVQAEGDEYTRDFLYVFAPVVRHKKTYWTLDGVGLGYDAKVQGRYTDLPHTITEAHWYVAGWGVFEPDFAPWGDYFLMCPWTCATSIMYGETPRRGYHGERQAAYDGLPGTFKPGDWE